MAFEFIKNKEKIHIVNIGEYGPEGGGGEGWSGVAVCSELQAKVWCLGMCYCIPSQYLCPPGSVNGGEAWLECERMQC